MRFPPPARVFVILVSAAGLLYPKVSPDVRLICVVAIVGLYVTGVSAVEHAKHKYGSNRQ